MTDQISGIKEFKEFIIEFGDETDRAAVILGVAKLDSIMYQILRIHLIPVPSSSDELLDSDRPLGSFSAKIHTLFRLGLIDASFAGSLHIVRRIRNAFAHEVKGCTLSSGAQSDRVRELSAPFRRLPFFKVFKDAFFENKSGPEIDFRVCLALMAGRLENMLANAQPISTANMWYMIPEEWTKPIEFDKETGGYKPA